MCGRHCQISVDEIRGQLNKISDEYKTILRTGDISMVTAEYDERLKQKGQESEHSSLTEKLFRCNPCHSPGEDHWGDHRAVQRAGEDKEGDGREVGDHL